MRCRLILTLTPDPSWLLAGGGLSFMNDQFLVSALLNVIICKRVTGGQYIKLQLSNGLWMYATHRRFSL